MPLTFSLDQLVDDNLHLRGEEDPAFLELVEGDFAARRPVRYDLQVAKLGDLLHVHGRAEATLDACCGRCLGEFPLTVSLDDDHLAIDLEPGLEVIDLRPAVREDLMLALPSFPRCEDGDALEDGSERRCPAAGHFERRESPTITEDGTLTGEGGDEEAGAERWKALDGLDDLDQVPDPSPED